MRKVNEVSLSVAISFVFLIIQPLSLSAQPIKQVLSDYFTGKYLTLPKLVYTSDNAYPALLALKPYLNDNRLYIRAKAHKVVYQIVSNTNDKVVRTYGTKLLIEGCKDKNSGNVLGIFVWLTTFKTDDFDIAAKDSIRVLFHSKIEPFDQLLRLVGFLELVDLKEEIRQYIMKPGVDSSIQWAARVSLARMGDSYALLDIMEDVRDQPTTDELVDFIYPDLIYTRQREALNFIIELILSDTKNCWSIEENSKPIECGYELMKKISSAIENFPLQLDKNGEDIFFNDPKALAAVRTWLINNKDYRIVRNTFW